MIVFDTLCLSQLIEMKANQIMTKIFHLLLSKRKEIQNKLLKEMIQERRQTKLKKRQKYKEGNRKENQRRQMAHLQKIKSKNNHH